MEDEKKSSNSQSPKSSEEVFERILFVETFNNLLQNYPVDTCTLPDLFVLTVVRTRSGAPRYTQNSSYGHMPPSNPPLPPKGTSGMNARKSLPLKFLYYSCSTCTTCVSPIFTYSYPFNLRAECEKDLYWKSCAIQPVRECGGGVKYCQGPQLFQRSS